MSKTPFLGSTSKLRHGSVSAAKPDAQRRSTVVSVSKAIKENKANASTNLIQIFETELSVPELASKEGGPEVCRGVFIRAPAILEVGPEVEVLVDYAVPADKWKNSNLGVEGHEENSGSEKKVIVARS